jgi:tape measure domain-containing protein
MTQTSRLVVELDSRNAEQKAADTRKALAALEDQGLRVPASLRKTSDSIQQVGTKSSEATTKVSGMERQLRSMASMAAGIAAPLAAAFSVTKIAQAAEEYTNLTNRLRLVTESSAQLARAQDDVFRVAQSSRQALDTTAQVYQRIAQNGKQLGLNLEQVASITETVAKSVALSGASAQAADAAMVQFGQALASGTLRGDELNSIMEQTPALAQAIARGLGVTIGELRSMGAEGKLTSEAIVTALQNQKDKVDELSSTLQVTASQAITAFGNSLVVTVGKLDQATSASSKFAQGILSLSQAMDRFNSGEFLDFFRDDKQTVAGLNNQLSETMSKMRDLGAVRAKLIKGDAGDTAFYKFKLYNVDDLDKEISALEKQAGTITQLTKKMKTGAAAVASQSPSGDPRSAPVNAAYEKMLETLKKQAALQGENSEAAKVRYAIENGELGKLLPAQSQLLLKYAQEKDAKVAAAKAAKEGKSYTEDAGMKALDAARQTQAVLIQQNASLNSQGVATERVGTQAQALIKWEQQLADIKGKKTLTADQKSLLASQDLITAQLKKNVALEREAEISKGIQQAQKDQVQLLTLTGQLREANSLKSSLDDAAQLAEYERQGSVEAAKRLETLIKIRDINLKAAQKPGTIEGVTQAPTTPGLDASVGGAGSEIDRLDAAAVKLEQWRATELERQAAYLDLKAINEETYAARVANIDQQATLNRQKIEEAKNQALLVGASDFFGNMASLSQSGNKKLAAIGKAAAIVQATMDGYLAVQKALAAFPPPFNFAAAAAVGVATAANVANIAGIGFSNGGYTGSGGVNEAAGMVHKGEVVWSQKDIQRYGGVAAVEALRKGNVSPIRPGAKGTGPDALAKPQLGTAPVVNVIEDASKAGQSQSREIDGRWVIDQFVANINDNGKGAKAIQQMLGMGRAAR